MPAPFFTNNPSDFTKLEGLYIDEKNPPGFIQGVDLNTIAVMGQTIRGPVDQAVEINSPQRFIEVFGGRDYGSGGALVNQVWRFLLNKPFGKVVVCRAAASAAVASSLTVEEDIDGTGTEVVRIDAASVGVWGNDVHVRVEDASDADPNHWNLRVKYLGVETLYENLDTTTSNDNLAETIGDDLANIVLVTKLTNGRPATFSTITEGDWITKDDTDNFMALGTTLTAYTSVAGADGAINSTDYTAPTRAFDQIKNRNGVSVVAYAEDDTTIVTALNTQIGADAALSNDRLFLAWSGDHTDTAGDAATDGGLQLSDRIVKCYNSPYTVDPETGLEVQTPPVDWMAAILSQIDVDIHPGEEATKAFTAGISRLTREDLTRGDYVSLRAGGVCALERDEGFSFVSGVTTSQTTGLTEITRRRMADFLQLSAANRLKYFVKKKNSASIRSTMVAELDSFSQELKDQERVIELYEIDNTSVNSDAQRAKGIEKILWRVRLLGHILHLVLETEIGTGVTIEAS